MLSDPQILSEMNKDTPGALTQPRFDIKGSVSYTPLAASSDDGPQGFARIEVMYPDSVWRMASGV